MKKAHIHAAMVASSRSLISFLRLLLVGVCWSFAVWHVSHAQVVRSGKVTQIQAPSPGNDCTYFQLEGVAVADPAVSGGPWFALAKSHNGYKEALTSLYTAKLSGLVVTLVTTGTGACGAYAGINWLEY